MKDEPTAAQDRPERELDLARRLRLERDRDLTMSERLAKLHELCKQMTSIRGAAGKR